MNNESSPKHLKYLPVPVEVPDEDPFRNDAFGREIIAKNLTKLVSSFAEQAFVLGINGAWGSGKTKFLEMWRAHLKGEKFRTLYFNAWENDYSDDPFAAVLTEFRKLADEITGRERSKALKMWDKVAEKSVPILARAASGLVKNVSLGLLDLENTNAEAGIAELAEESAKHALEKCEAAKKSISAFRAELESFVKAEGDVEKPVIFMIDELDRCRPPFAISVLERIKHLLNVPGIVFVFAWDRSQLDHTIQAIYGPQADAGGYLLRIVDLEMSLPQGGDEELCKSLMARFSLSEFFQEAGLAELIRTTERDFVQYAKIFDLSMRDQEKAFIALTISCRTGVVGDARVINVALLLILLRLKRPDVYKVVCRVSGTYEELLTKTLPSLLGRDFWNSSKGAQIHGCFLHNAPDALRKQMVSLMEAQRRMNSDSYEASVLNGLYFSGEKNGVVVSLIKQMEFVEVFWS